MSELLISVVIPTCDRPHALSQCLRSLSSDVQTFNGGQYEIIVSDDGTSSFPEELLSAYPALKYRRGARMGPAANRNQGARAACGRYLAFIDDDCTAAPQWLSAFAQASSEGGEPVFEGRTTTDYPLKDAFAHAPINETGGYLWSCNFMIERELFNKLGGFDPQFPYPFLEDVDFRTRLLAAGYAFRFVENAVVVHPQRALVTPSRYA
ncbi:MAG: glycosyltransferase family 2 protein, partial [Candidatus Saccharimonadales bacterium]